MDPLADQRSWVSPYNYVQNNPILRIDPTGALDTLPGAYTGERQPASSENTGDFWTDLINDFKYAADQVTWLGYETAAGIDQTQLGGAGEKALDGEYVAAAGLLVTEVAEKKLKINIKGSPFGPKIANSGKELSNGVPKGWSKEKISNIIEDFKTSIISRVNEWRHFNKRGGDKAKQAGHARRISIEEDYLKSLEKAQKSRK